jgi:methionyl-tRNA synthetase
MPSRKLTDHCPKCGSKNHLRAKHCNDCGARLPEKRVSDEEAQGKLHADIAHPINSECRARLQDVILQAYREELRRAGRAEEAERVVGQVEPGMAEAPPPAVPEGQAEPKPPDQGRFGEGIV